MNMKNMYNGMKKGVVGAVAATGLVGVLLGAGTTTGAIDNQKPLVEMGQVTINGEPVYENIGIQPNSPEKPSYIPVDRVPGMTSFYGTNGKSLDVFYNMASGQMTHYCADIPGKGYQCEDVK